MKLKLICRGIKYFREGSYISSIILFVPGGPNISIYLDRGKQNRGVKNFHDMSSTVSTPHFQISTKSCQAFTRYELSKIGLVSSFFSLRQGVKVIIKWKWVIQLP